MRFIYSFLVFLASLAVLPISLILDPPGPDGRAWKQRLGRLPALPGRGGRRLWIQAVSVGEVQLARKLLEELQSAQPGVEVLLTSTTPAGRKLAQKLASPDVRVAAFPLDLPFCAAGALDRVRPDVLVLVETEIWPNLIRACARKKVKVAIANGRISERTFPRYRFFSRALRPVLQKVDRFLMRSDEDARRITALGAPVQQVQVTGDLKWDLPVTEAPAAALRRDLGLDLDAPVFVAGSTFKGEESAVLEAYSALRAEFPTLQLILAPRHPARFEEVARALQQRGIPFRRRSTMPGAAGSPAVEPAQPFPAPLEARPLAGVNIGERLGDLPTGGSSEQTLVVQHAVPKLGPGAAVAVLLLDTVGDLRRAYGAGTICFVGGSLVKRGGQNLLEPAAAGRPVIFGPRTENFAEAAKTLLAAGAGFRIESREGLLTAARDLLRNSARCEEAGARGAALVAANRGAAKRTALRILELLEEPESA
ncbi:MAG TPA: 3-deoxy-D-manno-octulosonic acid transferase [Candidatus Polarisedimenticolia bacterium]|nr:3-deoxy-D-manno-octulosonic acid transferase [Candidatus Polarisedimenticolia bacterium]